jgi:cell division protein FtsB
MAKAEHRRGGRNSAAERRRRPKPSSLTRLERRAAISHRRAVVALFGSVLIAAVVLVAWFPASALLDQHRTLASTDATLAQLKAEDHALSVESKNLSTSTEIARIARQQFELVGPGEQAYQVLPPAGTSGGATDPYSGDPGLSAPVTPSAAPELPPGSLTTASATPAKTASHTRVPSSPGLMTRLLRTLEFWR